MNLVDLDTFAHVVAAGSLTAAAKELGVPKSTVSRRVSKLEDALGVPLLRRTGRSVTVTETGRRLHARTNGPLREIHDVERELRDGADDPGGTLRVTAPSDIGSSPWCARLFATYRALCPRVRVEVELTNRVVDLIGESFDVALRPSGVGGSEALVSKRLVSGASPAPDALPVGLYASRAYLRRRGTPTELPHLEDHDCVVHPAFARGGVWRLERLDGSRAEVRPPPSVVANSFSLVVQLVLDDAGIAALPRMLVARMERDGLVAPLLSGWGMRQGGLYAVWPASRHLAPRVRAFVDHATAFAAALDPMDWDQSFVARRPLLHGDLEPPA